MGSLDLERVDSCIESICARGCASVRRDIATLEAGGDLSETRALTPAERRRLLDELRQIMSVYGDACPVERR
ncbi:MAG: hypothetical protein EOM91_06065 [Sphingobacteriia bacterium]|nr:hypothetical protein [Sphingobacteriia bacterium]NCC39700.1 hypothetical protein [Gammaproteobacteria bacterium]